MDVKALELHRWYNIFILLSLDIVKTFHEQMGLGWLPPNFVLMLRWLISENAETPKEEQVFVHNVFHEMKQLLDPNQEESFHGWATRVFKTVFRDQPQWSAWHILFHRSAYVSSDRLLFLGDRLEKILSDFREIVCMKDVRQMIDKLNAQPFSSWDLEMYQIQGFESDGVNDPLDIILETVEIFRFQRFWKLLSLLLSPEEFETLWTHGKDMLCEMNIEVSLVHPFELDSYI